jgi:hypothetical protein
MPMPYKILLSTNNAEALLGTEAGTTLETLTTIGTPQGGAMRSGTSRVSAIISPIALFQKERIRQLAR